MKLSLDLLGALTIYEGAYWLFDIVRLEFAVLGPPVEGSPPPAPGPRWALPSSADGGRPVRELSQHAGIGTVWTDCPTRWDS